MNSYTTLQCDSGGRPDGRRTSVPKYFRRLLVLGRKQNSKFPSHGARQFRKQYNHVQTVSLFSFAHINGVNSLAIPNVREITKGQTIERQRRGMWSQHEMIQQINAALASRRHLVDNRMEEDISQRDEASGAVLYDEMSPYYRRSPRRTQYWNPNA